MKSARITIITENQNSREKAVKLANMVSGDLGNEIELNVSPYEKFENSWKIDILFRLTDSINYIEGSLEKTSKISTPWTVWYTADSSEINLIFNKTEDSRFHRNEYNVIRWANFDLIDE